MQNSSYRILSYKVRRDYGIGEFLNSYQHLLQKAIDVIWDNIEWIKKKQRNYFKCGKGKIKKYYYAERLIPIIPKSKEFKRNLRNRLLKDWNYASHYVRFCNKNCLFNIKLMEKELH